MSKRVQNGLLSALFWLAVWTVLAAAVGKELILPSPAAVVRRLGELALTGEFRRGAWMSLGRVALGFALASALGCALGCVTWAWKWCDVLLSPALRAVRTVPVVSFILLLYFWFPTQWVPTVVAGLMALPVVWRGARQGAESADPLLTELACHYELGEWKTFRLVRLPAALPALGACLETALGLSWKAGLAGEVLCQPKWGLGTGLQGAKASLDTPALFAWTVTMVVLGGVTEWLLKLCFRRGREGER